MKKITLLLALSISLCSYAQLPETFDTEIPATWAVFAGVNGEGTVQSWQHNAAGYVFCQYESVATIAEDWLVSPQVAVTASSSILTFDWTKAYATDYGSSYSIRISTASQTTHADFTTVATYTEADVTTELTFQPASVDLSAYIGSSVYIAFVLTQNDGDNMYVDNVDLVANATAPDPATTPTPMDGAVDVFVDPTDGDMDGNPDNAVAFDWEPAATGDAATSYDVYLGDSATTLNLLGNTSMDDVNITGMTYSTEYFWQIVAKNVGGDAVGSEIWSFTTEADPGLSVNDFEKDKFTHFYDNELNTLNLESTDLAFSSIEIYSILGQKALAKTLSNKNEAIDVSSLSTGIYLAKVNINGIYSTVKFIKK